MASAAVQVPRVSHPRPVEKLAPISVPKHQTPSKKKVELTTKNPPNGVSKNVTFSEPLISKPIDDPNPPKTAGKRPREPEPPAKTKAEIIAQKKEDDHVKKELKKKITLRKNLEGKPVIIFSAPVRHEVAAEICQSINEEFYDKERAKLGWNAEIFDGKRLTLHPSEEEKEFYAREYRKEYRSRPTNVQKRVENSKKPEVIQKRREYALRPDVIERKKQKAKERREILRKLKREHPSVYKELSGDSIPPVKRLKLQKDDDSEAETSTSTSQDSDDMETEK